MGKATDEKFGSDRVPSHGEDPSLTIQAEAAFEY